VAFWSKPNKHCASTGLVFEESVPDMLARIAAVDPVHLAGKLPAKKIERHGPWQDAVRAVEQSLRDNMLGWHVRLRDKLKIARGTCIAAKGHHISRIALAATSNQADSRDADVV
jgi:hypothetical protein